MTKNTKINAPTTTKRQLIWFENRVKKSITKNCASDLFNPPVLITSKMHAKALYASQDKGNRYEYKND